MERCPKCGSNMSKCTCGKDKKKPKPKGGCK